MKLKDKKIQKFIENDSLIRDMCNKGESLAAMSRILHSHTEDIHEYILDNNIPHEPFTTARKMEKNFFWKGGKGTDCDGYILILSPNHPFRDSNGYVREHRLVMEKVLGRYLEKSEVVHHIDGNKKNNAPENLEVFNSNSQHLKHELTGKVPNWSESGRKRTIDGVMKWREQRRLARENR